ncbi:hypothetical protein Q1695_008048 [Nippostrongylus brasiliensis]|nr:hypothetical protein Q1695_008048 [Nippostrongylus brasiliensis]
MMLQSASGDPQGTLKMAIDPYPPPMDSPPLSCHGCVVGTAKARRRAHPNGELSVRRPGYLYLTGKANVMST